MTETQVHPRVQVEFIYLQYLISFVCVSVCVCVCEAVAVLVFVFL